MSKLEELKGKKRKQILYSFEKLEKYIESYKEISEIIEAIRHDNIPLRLHNVEMYGHYYSGARAAFMLLDEMMDEKLEERYIKSVVKKGIESLKNMERIMRNEPIKFCNVYNDKGKVVGCSAHFTKQVIITDD